MLSNLSTNTLMSLKAAVLTLTIRRIMKPVQLIATTKDQRAAQRKAAEKQRDLIYLKKNAYAIY